MAAFDNNAAGGVFFRGVIIASPPRETIAAVALSSIFLSYSATASFSSAASQVRCRDKRWYKPDALQVAPVSQRALITGTQYMAT